MDPLGSNEGGGRRVHPRYKVSFRVSLMREDSPEVGGEITDLSVGGCFVESDGQVREDDLVRARGDSPRRRGRTGHPAPAAGRPRI